MHADILVISKIYIQLVMGNTSIFCTAPATFHNDPQHSIMPCNASLRIVKATANTCSGRVHSPTWG